MRSCFQEIPTTPNSHKIQRHKNFDQVLHWVSDEFEQSDKVYMTPFKEKYVKVYGSPAKNWEKVSRRGRGRLNLEAKSIMETLQLSYMVLGEKSMKLEWFSLF